MRLIWIILIAFWGCGLAPQKSRIQVSKDLYNNFVFRVKVDPAYSLVLDAPWNLKLSPAYGLTFKQTEYSRNDVNSKIPGFIVPSYGLAPKWYFSYTARVFFCTLDKKKCFFENHDHYYSSYEEAADGRERLLGPITELIGERQLQE